MSTDDSRKIYVQIFNAIKFVVSDCDKTEVYAQYKNFNGYYEFCKVNDEIFHAFVRESYRILSKEDSVAPYSSILEEYIDKALLNPQPVTILSRIGGNSEETAYFLANKQNAIILVNKDGIKKIRKSKKYYFYKKASSKAQVNYKLRKRSLLDELKPFLNMDEDMQILFTTMLVQNFLCTSSHFLGIISSQQGSGKTTFTNMIRRLIDPSIASVTTMPDNADALKTQLSNNYVVCYDNTQALTNEFSDILCGAVTGSASSKRKLYSNNDEVIIKFHNAIFINGIDVVPNRSDLLERSILFKLNTISQSQRKSEDTIKQKFDNALPYILGAIITTLKGYYQNKDTIKPVGNHRMAGAYKECYIIADFLGVTDKFVKAFNNNQKLLLDTYSDTNPVVSAVVSYMKFNSEKKTIKCPVQSFYNEIKLHADRNNFPKSASAFSRELKIQSTTLYKLGYSVSFTKKHLFTELTISECGRK